MWPRFYEDGAFAGLYEKGGDIAWYLLEVQINGMDHGGVIQFNQFYLPG